MPDLDYYRTLPLFRNAPVETSRCHICGNQKCEITFMGHAAHVECVQQHAVAKTDGQIRLGRPKRSDPRIEPLDDD